MDLVLAVCFSCTVGIICGECSITSALNQREVGDREGPGGFPGIAGQGTPDAPFASLSRWMNVSWHFDILKNMLDTDIHVNFHIIGRARII